MTSMRTRGFSLIELLVTITIVAILLVLAVPNYREWMANTRVRGAAESIQNGLRVARNEASQRGVNVRFELTSTDSSWQVCQLAATETVCSSSNSTFIEKHDVADTKGVLVTASKSAATLTDYANAVSGNVPGGITFSPLARPLSADYNNTALIRIDTASAIPNTRRLVTTITAGGSVQMCDAGLKSSVAANGCLK